MGGQGKVNMEPISLDEYCTKVDLSWDEVEGFRAYLGDQSNQLKTAKEWFGMLRQYLAISLDAHLFNETNKWRFRI